MLKNMRKIEGSGGGGSSSPDPPYEAPNTLRSKSTARVMDLVSEGEIEGLQGGLKGVYLDEVVVQNSDDTYNFEFNKVQRLIQLRDTIQAFDKSRKDAENANR